MHHSCLNTCGECTNRNYHKNRRAPNPLEGVFKKNINLISSLFFNLSSPDKPPSTATLLNLKKKLDGVDSFDNVISVIDRKNGTIGTIVTNVWGIIKMYIPLRERSFGLFWFSIDIYPLRGIRRIF